MRHNAVVVGKTIFVAFIAAGAVLPTPAFATPKRLDCLINGERIGNATNLYVYLNEGKGKAVIGNGAIVPTAKDWLSAAFTSNAVSWSGPGAGKSTVHYRLDRATGAFTTKHSKTGVEQSFVCKQGAWTQ